MRTSSNIFNMRRNVEVALFAAVLHLLLFFNIFFLVVVDGLENNNMNPADLLSGMNDDEVAGKLGSMSTDDLLSQVKNIPGASGMMDKMGGADGVKEMLEGLGGVEGLGKMFKDMGGVEGLQDVMKNMGAGGGVDGAGGMPDLSKLADLGKNFAAGTKNNAKKGGKNKSKKNKNGKEKPSKSKKDKKKKSTKKKKQAAKKDAAEEEREEL